MAYDLAQFIGKYQLALETAQKENPDGGLCGLEVEWNLLDEGLRPLLTVGAGPGQKSFVDFLIDDCLAPWARPYTQLEVFHWMVEWVTRPYYSPRAAIYEARLMEALLLNALSRAGAQFGEHLYAWHGNLLFPTSVVHDSIPYSLDLAKRRYLERCVDLYGPNLATTGTHSNLSLPDPLFAWDFMHLSAAERGDMHLEAYKSHFYITATRLMRAFASLFIAASAATPLEAQYCDDQPVVRLTEFDSVRCLTFPAPSELDLPQLYRSYEDYLSLSYELVRGGVRFGNNNWTPVRARSFADPVWRLVDVTSEQLGEIYQRGLYALGEAGGENGSSVEEMAHQVEIQNLLARIDLPMARVEVRTDDGGNPLDVDIANMTLKHLLMLRIYADSSFARAFRYDSEDIERARRNENTASRDGLRAQIENPFTAKPVQMREFLGWTLEQVRPIAEALGMWEDLAPLESMAAGGPNTAEQIRTDLQNELGDCEEVPLEALKSLAEERQGQVVQDAARIAEGYRSLAVDRRQIGEFLQRARDEAHFDPAAPVRFRRRAAVEVTYASKTDEIVELASSLVRIPSVTACPEERLDEVRRAATFIYDYLGDHGLEVRYFHEDRYPALLVGFPGGLHAPVMLSGHFDVVAPEPDESQFEPRLEGDYLWGRGAADMKTVVATYMVWLKDTLRRGAPYPPVNLLLVGNEEPGEIEPMGTPHVLAELAEETRTDGGVPYAPQLLIAGERTGETGDELWGKVCTQNRGVMRCEIITRAARGHTGTAGAAPRDLVEVLLARAAITGILGSHLTLSSEDGWRSTARFPFVQVGTPGIYNISAGEGLLGLEVRPIPQDDLDALLVELEAYCASQGFELSTSVMEEGIICDPANPYLGDLLEAVRQTSGGEPVIGRKLPGTSARFSPGSQGVVWGQTGIGPHAANERHYIPSIEPYYRALEKFGELLLAK